jgi:hypothetical protein
LKPYFYFLSGIVDILNLSQMGFIIDSFYKNLIKSQI